MRLGVPRRLRSLHRGGGTTRDAAPTRRCAHVVAHGPACSAPTGRGLLHVLNALQRLSRARRRAFHVLHPVPSCPLLEQQVHTLRAEVRASLGQSPRGGEILEALAKALEAVAHPSPTLQRPRLALACPAVAARGPRVVLFRFYGQVSVASLLGERQEGRGSLFMHHSGDVVGSPAPLGERGLNVGGGRGTAGPFARGGSVASSTSRSSGCRKMNRPGVVERSSPVNSNLASPAPASNEATWVLSSRGFQVPQCQIDPGHLHLLAEHRAQPGQHLVAQGKRGERTRGQPLEEGRHRHVEQHIRSQVPPSPGARHWGPRQP